MTTTWTLLIDADLSQPDWQYSALTDATLLRIEQENIPRIGRFSIAQVTADQSEFLDIKGYPAAAETTRLSLDYFNQAERLIAVRPTYSEFAEGIANNWWVRIYGSKPDFQPPINPSAILLTLDPRIAGAIPLEEKGIPLGVATLGADGLVDDDQLPTTGLAELVAANLEAVDALSNQLESLPPPPTLASLGAEPAGAEARAKQYTDEEIAAIAFLPPPTLASLGAEPAGAEARAKQYTDEEIAAIAFPPPPTLASLGAEPAGAELRAKQYTDEEIAAIAFPPPPTLASLGAEPAGAESRAKAYVDQRFPIVAPPTTEIRINCGSIQYTDVAGKVWAADQYSEFGNPDVTYTGLVGATYDFLLFNSSRSGGNPGFSYKIPVPNGNYRVELGFSENWHNTVNSRKFNVFIEGTQVLTGFDIRAQAGMRYSAIKRVFTTTVSDGILNLQFVPTVDGAQVNNIYVCSI